MFLASPFDCQSIRVHTSCTYTRSIVRPYWKKGLIPRLPSALTFHIRDFVFPVFASCRQLLIAEPMSDHSIYSACHAIDSINMGRVVAMRELVNVAVQMLDAHIMMSPVVTALEKRPERLDPVSVHSAANILTDAMDDDLMVKTYRTDVARVRICV